MEKKRERDKKNKRKEENVKKERNRGSLSERKRE